ncbi:MAG TPA: zinc-binding alcohol dehydrogenase family protein [Dyella sp.]|uniref:zinc-binding alcohol dehydrogenase family protein n=1 Tax=Dyella sp. TaxID=1869338 RepID=UPI002CF24CE1|nr:zinc-binding alcohol dehydrogenase family protein [Dyella sp.]HUB91444.1 zinc-binding alcohol dehydrogenase family protein [Dyella sp.]
MKAWQFSPGETPPLALVEQARPVARRGAVVVRMRAVPLLSYLGDYVRGSLARHYQYPEQPFVIGTNGVGVVEAVGEGVHHYKPGQAVLVHPYVMSTENVDDPVEVLSGLTGTGPQSTGLLNDWPDGSLSEFAAVPATVPVSLEGLTHIAWERLASLGKFIVPFGGLRRGRLAAGETVIVNGASGYFGAAAVLLALAMGAERVVATARDVSALQTLAAMDKRVRPVALGGSIEHDTAALREATDGGAHMAFDMVGRACDANSTLSALGALRRRGRLVLMGSMSVPLPLDYGQMLINQWEVIGHFMYSAEDSRRLIRLVRAGLLDLEAVRLQQYALEELPQAMDAAARMRGLDCTVVKLNG